jgi:hypothetical protein
MANLRCVVVQPFILARGSRFLFLASPQLISSVLDFEKQSSYSVLVEVSDNGDYPEPLSASAIVTIIIMDVNESPAVSDVSISVAEFWVSSLN